MAECPPQDQVEAFARGDPSAEPLRAHVESCGSCARRLFEVLYPESSASEPTPSAEVDASLSRRDLPEDPGARLDRGTTVGRYVVLDQLGLGGMGVVYAAYDPELDRKVALKLLHAASLGKDPSAQALLLREAQAMAKLSHPNVVSVFDVGTFRDRVFVAMELVDGRTGRAWLTEANPSVRQVIDVYLAAGRGLEAAHRTGLVHRDFKPDNVLVSSDGRVRVMDFGLARAQPGALTPPPEVGPASASLLSETESSARGTPAYMAPEQIAGKSAGAAADQFAFAVSVYEALYKERPFEGHPLLREARTRWVVREPPRGSKVPAALRRALLRGLDEDPGRRHPSLGELLSELGRDPLATRKRLAFGAAAAIALGAVGLGGAELSQRTARLCQDAEENLAGRWDARIRDEVLAAFRASSSPHAEFAFREAARAVDAYTASWVEMRQDACAATRVRGEQSDEVLTLRMSCLDQRLDEVAALSALFTRADAQVVEKAVQVAGSLSSLSDCADVETLRAAVRPPSDPQVRARLSELHKTLASVEALTEAAKYKPALELLTPVQPELSQLGYKPAIAHGLLLEATLHNKLGKAEPSEETAHQALWAAEAGRVDARAAQAVILLLRLAQAAGRLEEADRWGRLAEAVIARLGRAEELSAELAFAQGVLENARGNDAHSLERYQAALAIRERIYGADHPLVAQALQGVANAHFSFGNYDEAEEFYGRAIRTYERTLGPEHPDLTISLGNLGTLTMEKGEFGKSLGYYQRALKIREAALGPAHPRVLWMRGILGINLRELERYDEALAVHRAALADLERIHPPDHPEVALGAMNLGETLLAVSRPAEAQALFQRARESYEKTGHASLAVALEGLGLAHQQQGRPSVALGHYQRALELRFKGGEHVDGAESLLGVGRAKLALGDRKGALAALERALALVNDKAMSPKRQAEARLELARALWADEKARPRARELAEQARDDYRRTGQAEHAAAAERWLAEHAATAQVSPAPP